MMPYNPVVEIIDSRDDAKITYVVVGQCKTPVLKARINQTCYILRLIDDVCHIDLGVDECGGE